MVEREYSKKNELGHGVPLPRLGIGPQRKRQISVQSVGGVCNFLSSASPQQRFEMVDQCYSSVSAQFYRQAKDSLPSKCEGRLTPKGESLNLSWLYLFIHLVSSLLSLPFANWASQEGDVFVSPEFLTLVHGFSFVPFSQDFPFPCLLATAILDFFFLF